MVDSLVVVAAVNVVAITIVVVVGGMCETTALEQFSSHNKQISLSKYVKFFHSHFTNLPVVVRHFCCRV